MSQHSLGRFIRVAALLLAGLTTSATAQAQATAPAKGGKVVAETTPGFCWNDSVARGAGAIPGRNADCPDGYSMSGGSCKRAANTVAAPSRAADCPAGYNNTGASCERAAQTKPNANSRLADCPEGFKNTDGACFRLSAAAPLDASKMSCKAGETRIEARCFRACEAGFTGSGATCTRPAGSLGADNMTCKAGFQKSGKAGRCAAVCAAGFTNTGEACVKAADALGVDAMTCKAGETRVAGRCLPAGGGCADGEVQQGDLCYKACAAGFDGVGSACFKQPPKAWMQCGTGSAKDAQACAATTFNPAMSVRQTAVLAGFAGSSRFGRERATTKKKFKGMVDAYNKAKDTPQFKKGFDAWEDAGKNAPGTRLAMDKLASAESDEDMVRYAAQVASIAELSGAAGDDAYPKCGTLFPAK